MIENTGYSGYSIKGIMTTPKNLSLWIENWLSKSGLSTQFDLFSLAGDGSTRQFFRLKTPSDSFIILFDPNWTLSQDYPSHQSFLETAGISVPKFFAADAKAGCLVMEDLGDELLQMRLLDKPTRKMDWLKNAIELLAALHGKTFPVRPDLPVSTRRFDQKKYFEEFQFTLEHLSKKLLGQPSISSSEMEKIGGFCKALEKISPEVFAHRDYHCRNLLIHGEKLVMIDFQDARLGPPHYDLASILYDAYMPITKDERNELLSIYRRKTEEFTLGDAIHWETFDRDLKLVAYQRTIKAAGSFASFYTRYKKKTHLPYLLPALQSAHMLAISCGTETALLQNALPLEKWIELSRKVAVK